MIRINKPVKHTYRKKSSYIKTSKKQILMKKHDQQKKARPKTRKTHTPPGKTTRVYKKTSVEKIRRTKKMKYKTKIKTGLTIMTIAIVLGVISFITKPEPLWDISQLIFVIGLIITNLAYQARIRQYQTKYGDIGD